MALMDWGICTLRVDLNCILENLCVQTILAVAKDKPCILLMELEHQLRDCREIQIVEMIADVLFFLSSASTMSSSVQSGHFNSPSFHAHLSI